MDARTTVLAILGRCNWVAWWFRAKDEVEPVVDTIIERATQPVCWQQAGPRPG